MNIRLPGFAFFALLLPSLLTAAYGAGSTTAREVAILSKVSYASPAASAVELDARIRAILSQSAVPGMIGAIVDGDNVVWQGAIGTADLRTSQPVTTATQFRIGSVSKMFISLSVLRLVEQGRLSLQAPLRTVTPDFGMENPWEATDPVRIVHVLEHTSGFDDLRFRDFTNDSAGKSLLDGMRYNIGSKHSRWRPGTRASYSNFGAFTAALAVEHITRVPFGDFVTSEIFQPLGMNTASFVPGPNSAISHRLDGTPIPLTSMAVRPAGALALASGDMIQLLRFFHGRGTINGHAVLTSASIDRMEHPRSLLAARAGMRVGMGLGNCATLRNGFLFQGHTGGIEDFSSTLAYLPEHRRGYFFSLNADDDVVSARIRKEMDAYITRGLSPLSSPPAPSIREDDLRKLTGVYVPDSPSVQLFAGPLSLAFETFRLRDGALHMSSPWGGSRSFIPAGGNLFRVANEPIARMAFVRTPEGDLLAQTEKRSYKRVPALVGYGRPLLIAFSALLLMSTLIYAPVWFYRLTFEKSFRHTPYLSLRVLPLLGMVSLLLPFMLARMFRGSMRLDSPTVFSVALFVCPLLFALLSILANVNFALQFRHRHQVNRIVFVYSGLVAGAMLIITLFLATSGYLGLRTWAF